MERLASQGFVLRVSPELRVEKNFGSGLEFRQREMG